MDGKKLLNCLEFDDDTFVDDDVDPISTVQFHRLVYNWQGNLPAKPDTLILQLKAEALLVGRFEKPRPKCAMDLYR
jgi:hypothetical protein